MQYLVILQREARYQVNADDETAALRDALLQERLEDYLITGHRIERAPLGEERSVSRVPHL